MVQIPHRGNTLKSCAQRRVRLRGSIVYHLDKKGTRFVYLLQQKYTSKLYGRSQPCPHIYFNTLTKVASYLA